MSVLFIGKRFYTNRDALREKYGRIYQLPWHWAESGIPTRLWLVDYHSREKVRQQDGALQVVSTPVRNLAVFQHAIAEAFGRNDKPDVVVASGDCYIGLMAYWIARRLRARFVFDVYDKYDEFGGYRRLPGFDPFQSLLRRVDRLLFASRALMEQADAGQARGVFVPNGVDLARFRPMGKGASRVQLGVSAEPVCVGYFGSMTPDRGVADLVSAVSLLRGQGRDVELLLAGNRADDIDLHEPWIHDFGMLSHDEVPAAMACCDVLALPYRHSAYLDMASSCKIAEYIAMERPLAATDTPNLHVNFPEQAKQLGELLAEPGNPEDLARVIAAQITEKRLVSLPQDFEWDCIAASAAHAVGLVQSAVTKDA